MHFLLLAAGLAAVSVIGRSFLSPAKPAATPTARTLDDAPLYVPPPPVIQPPDHPIVVDLEPVAPKDRKPRRARAGKRQKLPDVETFSDLLENLDDSFSSLRIPPIKGNWLPKRDIRALHKIGAFVPTPFQIEDVAGDVYVDTKVLPIISSAHMISRKYDSGDKIYPRFVFALRETRLPINVEQFAGTPYRFGMSVELKATEHDPSSPLRSFWVWCWFVVGADGLVRIPSERRPAVQTIMHRHTQGDGIGRTSTFVTRNWSRPAMAQPDSGRSADDYEHWLKVCFRQLLKWWTARDECWSVAVKKDGHRVVFGVQPEHTSAYFADRDKSIRAADGTAKKIIHHVNAHTRANGSAVREHIRGLREFDWRGYACSVTAPRFTGALTTALFDLAPLSESDARDAENDTLLPLETVAGMLSEAEDKDIRNAA